MADNNNNAAGEAAASAPAEVAGSTPTPAQPTAAYQPAAYGQQTLNYQQNPNAYGQQYQGYQQYGYQQAAAEHQQAMYQQAGYYAVPYGTGYPQAVPQTQETKFWINSKMALHGVSVVFSIITFGMGISLVSGPVDISYLAAVACPVPVMCIIWSAAELIVRAVHKFERGIHPGGNVAATLIIWLAAAIVGALEGLFTATVDGYCDYSYDPDTYSYDRTNCYNPWAGRWGLWIAITTFTCLLFVIFFALFVMACIDTSKRNAAKRLVMVVNPANYWGPQAQGWQQMPQQPLQNSQYMAAPQPAATREADIPLQQRTPSHHETPYATPMEVNEKGKEPEQPGHGIQEFYGAGRAQ